MLRGIVFAIAACFVWGFIYVIPQFMPGFSSIEVAVGRYSVFGILSTLLFLKIRWGGEGRYPLHFWIRALYFSLISSIGYYTLLVIALRYSSPAICALILGTSPITIAIYGNWKSREIPFRSLWLPSLLILVGLAMINIPHLQKGVLSNYLMGLFCSLLSLAAWTWYVVANSRFLKAYPHLNPVHWCTMIGVAALFWVILFGSILFFNHQIHFEKFQVMNTDLIHFIIGSLALGLFCSGLAEFLWNRASFYLPVALAGQLTILESLFAVLFVFVIDRSLPPLMEGFGMALQLIAILYAIRLFTSSQRSLEKPELG
jgi:drug/metabolite transporter (DMT)-like permease